jgi:1-acyl-sn-glycerol-3-phosphate acyltransferase
VSSCGVGCLPRGGPAAPLLRVARLLALGGVLLGGLAGMLVLLAAAAPGAGPRLRARLRAGVVGRWARGVLAALGVRLTVRGAPPRRAALVVANHISWLDVVALLAVVPAARLVAKAEVRDWPLIGGLARASGALFVDRSRPRALPTLVRRAARALADGAVVAGFPEGTTWCGPAAGPFRPALFQAALDAGARVVPVALTYRVGGAPSTAAAFLGRDTLWDSVRRVAGARGLVVGVDLTAALHPAAGTDRRALARVAETAVHAVPPRALR